MKQIKTYENKNILILGLGKSGFSVAKLLLKLGAKLTLNDKKDLSNDDRAAELDKLGVRVISGYHPVEIFDEEKLWALANTSDEIITRPWFGQLMTQPQLIAYLYQFHLWFKEYHINFIE